MRSEHSSSGRSRAGGYEAWRAARARVPPARARDRRNLRGVELELHRADSRSEGGSRACDPPLDCADRGHFHPTLVSARATAVTALLLLGVLALSVPAAASDVRLARVGGFDQPLFVTAPPGDRAGSSWCSARARSAWSRTARRWTSRFSQVPGVSTGNAEQGHAVDGLRPRLRLQRALLRRLHRLRQGRRTWSSTGRSASDPDRADRRDEAARDRRIRKSNPTHNGGQLQFGPDGLLYLSVGDGGCCGDTNNDAQRLGTLLGKILRIDPRGERQAAYTVPKARIPFVKRRGARREIYAYGLRNPFRFSFDRKTGAIAIGDVGDVDPDGQEEIDYLPEGKASGANFGWNVFEGRTPQSLRARARRRQAGARLLARRPAAAR